jgi:multiple sugar transport system permease protein
MIGLGFYKYTLTNPAAPRFLGIKTFLSIINDTAIWGSFGRTLLFVVLGVGIETFLGCLLAFLFWGSTSLPGRRLALTLLFAPMVLTPVAAGTFFKLIYDPTFGIANYLLSILGGKQVDFLGDAHYAYAAVLFVDIWMWTPFMTLMGLAALGSVPKAELESARVDRLPFFRVLKHVIWPHGKFVLLLGVILRTIESFKTMDLPYLMTSGGPGNKTELIAITLYRTAFNSFDMGKSSSLALITLLTAIAFTSIFLYILNSKNREASR